MMVGTATLEQERVATAPDQPETIPVQEVLDDVRRDSREEPQAFLDETVVPHGGE